MIDRSTFSGGTASLWNRGKAPLSDPVFSDSAFSNPACGRRIWLITFTDLVSLMLAFFVMLFAMSEVKVALWEVTTQSLSRTLDPSRSPPPPPVAARNVPTVVLPPALDLDYLATLLLSASRSTPDLLETRLVRVADGLVLVLNPGDVFVGEDVRLSPAAMRTLSAVGGILGNVSNRIGVRMRADAEVTLRGGHGSAWEFALIRAAAVANALRAAGYDRDIVAYGVTDGGALASADRVGYGADGGHGADGGQGEEGRIAQIEILILETAASGR
jgi:chemotaxis protein MotB